jgi:hypothetical protein
MKGVEIMAKKRQYEFGKGRLTQRVTVRFTEEFRNKLEDVSAELNISMSDLIYKAVAKELQSLSK